MELIVVVPHDAVSVLEKHDFRKYRSNAHTMTMLYRVTGYKDAKRIAEAAQRRLGSSFVWGVE